MWVCFAGIPADLDNHYRMTESKEKFLPFDKSRLLPLSEHFNNLRSSIRPGQRMVILSDSLANAILVLLECADALHAIIIGNFHLY